MPRTAADETYDSDAKGAYATLQTAAERHESEWGTLVKIGKSMLKAKCTSYADKTSRRDLQNLVEMRATAENSAWKNVLVMRDAANRVLVSAHEHDPSRPERERKTPTDSERVYGAQEAAKWETNKAKRALYREALASGADEATVRAAIKGEAPAQEKDNAN